MSFGFTDPTTGKYVELGGQPLSDEEMEGLCECCGEAYGEPLIEEVGMFRRYFCSQDCKEQWSEGSA